MQRKKTVMTVVLSVVLIPLMACAGNLEPPGAPSSGSGMPSLTDVYNQLISGAIPLPKTSFQEPFSEPIAGTGRTLSEIQGKLPGPDSEHGAISGNVLSGKAFWGLTSGQWGRQTGVMENNGGLTITPGTADQAISAGYHDGTGKVPGEPAMMSSNIPVGVTLFGVAGTKKKPWGCSVVDDYCMGHVGEECFEDCFSDSHDETHCTTFCDELVQLFCLMPAVGNAYCSR